MVSVNRIIFLFVFSVTSFSVLAEGESLNDFFADNPSLEKNIFTKQAITGQAQMHAGQQLQMEDTPPEKLVRGINIQLKERGYDYARLGVRTLSMVCLDEELAAINELKKDDCVLIIEAAKKD
ncbi:hypothetical protein [Yersinia sp. 2545 StPb PI]|uniref:hypothetical protein n=1 Tax=Yersinia sp. 2545 StPb PI TaxID=3117410 RepID=UPI003FA440D5